MAKLNLTNLRNAVLCYEEKRFDRESARRIAELVPQVTPECVAALAIEACERSHFRHAALLLVREMARLRTHRRLVSDTLEHIIQRPADLCEFVALYWQDGRVPLSSQVKRGLAAAFPKFDERQLSSYDDAGPIRLRDVLFLCHAKPRDDQQAGVWKKLIWGRLAALDTRLAALPAEAAEKGTKAQADESSTQFSESSSKTHI